MDDQLARGCGQGHQGRLQESGGAGTGLVGDARPRKPEWLAENLLNPFRDWDGREHISPAYAKKAALAYKNMLAMTRSIDAAMDGDGRAAAALEAMVTAYVDEFNKIERRSSIIETVEREEIYVVLAEVLAQLDSNWASRVRRWSTKRPCWSCSTTCAIFSSFAL